MWFPFLASDEVSESLRAAFDDVGGALRDASYRVRAELATARFDVGQDGKPTDPAIHDAIRDATKAQLAFWADTGDITGAGAQNGGGSILSVSLPGGAGTTSIAAKRDARVAPAVTEILRACDGVEWDVQY